MSNDPKTPSRRVALVCSNFTMQSAFGLLIIALNSARLGYSTLIYFTFEGLHMIRPGQLEMGLGDVVKMLN
jgi:peroxiredoxin family protein